MGIDITIYDVPFVEGAERDYDHELFSDNITHNLIPIWKKLGILDVLYEPPLGGTPGQLAPPLEDALSRLRNEPERFRKLQHSTWGRYEDALRFLENVAVAYRKHPNGHISISR